MSEHSTCIRSALTQRLLLQLRNDIILGKYNTGTKLSELVVANQFGVSRTVVRGVFGLLEREGLIETLPNGTRRVCGIDSEDIMNLYGLRKYLEVTAVTQIMGQKERNIQPFMDVMQRIASSTNQNIEEILDIDTAFHRAVIEASKNKALLQSWDTISGVMQAVFHLNMTESESYRNWFKQTFQKRHIELFTVLLGDLDPALKLYESHICDANEISCRVIQKLQMNILSERKQE